MRNLEVAKLRKLEAASAIGRIPGLLYRDCFVTPLLAAELVALVEGCVHWIPFGTRKQRLAFGFVYGIRERKIVGLAPAAPPLLTELAVRLVAEGMMGTVADQIVVQEYPAGVGIGEHSDSPVFGPDVCSLSLLSSCFMWFHRAGERGKGFRQTLEPGSALAITGEARSGWTHEIPGTSVAARRLSITFRTVLPECRPAQRSTGS